MDLPRVSSAPAVLVVPVDNRIFTLSFSRGSSLLQDEAIDPTFGLRTALNSVNPHRVRSYDKRSFDALFRQTREQASNETKLESFGIDAERDLVRSVSGKPTDSNLGSSMTGGSSLRVAAKVNPSTVTHYLRRLHRKFELDNFASEYPWLGQIEAVGDTEMQELLDSYLDDVLRGENATNRVFLSVPQIIDWSESSGFRFVLSSRSKHIFPEITLANLARATGENIFDVEFFKRQHVEMLDENDARLKLWSLYKCLNAEIEVGDEAYALSTGIWYRVDSRLVSAVNKAALSLTAPNFSLPAFCLSDLLSGGEPAFNERVAQQNDSFCCLDNKKIHFGGGRNQFELCDLVEAGGDLLHVKRYGGSSALSHLFAQGLVSATLAMERVGFRRDADKLLAIEGFSLPEQRSFSSKCSRSVVYTIIGGPANGGDRDGGMKSEMVEQLPLFARINLSGAKRKIESLGWKVELLWVPETEEVQVYRRQKRSG